MRVSHSLRSSRLCRKYFLVTNEYLVRVPLSANPEEFFDKLGLKYIVPLTDSLHLSFANHTHGFDASYSRRHIG